MNACQQVLERMKKYRHSKIDPSSLQFRLTVGIVAASIAGLGGLAVWTSWRMRSMLHMTHQESIEAIAQQLSTELSTIQRESSQDEPGANSDTDTLESQFQTALLQWSSPYTWLWIKQEDGTILAHAPTYTPEVQTNLDRLVATAPEPRVYKLDGDYILWCTREISLNGSSGWLYVAKDITQDYSMLLIFTRNLLIGTVIAIASLTSISALLIWRSLSPLRQTEQLVEAVTYTPQLRLNPEQMPGEVKALVSTCNRLLDQVSQSGEQQRQFTSGISHELRTPLSIIYGYLQSTLRRGSNLTPQQQEALQIAMEETEHTIDLLQDLLNLARVDSKAVPFTLQPVSLNDLVEEHLTSDSAFQSRKITIDAQVDAIIVIADRFHLNQVLKRLLDNAMQYSDADQPITIRLERSPNQGVLRVCDRGYGIPEAQQSQIFQPFYRVDSSRCKATGGVGLGLAIAKATIEGMNGAIAVESKLDQGSTFTITLPLLAQPSTVETSNPTL